MAGKQNPSRRASEPRGGAGQKAPSRRSVQDNTTQAPSRRATAEKQQQTPPRRSDVIRCENCGEDYSITYKRCPFCDERPGRTGVNGRRLDGGPTVHPVQIVGLVISLALIISALVIVFKYVGPLFFGDRSSGGSSSVGSSQSDASGSASSSGSQSNPAGSSSSGDTSQDDPVMVTVTSLTLSRNDFTLKAGEESQIIATVAPAEAASSIVWTSSHPDVITVDENGIVKNINSSSQKVKATITATCGDKTAECTVYCRPTEGGGTTPSTNSGTSTGTVSPNTPGVISGAGNGLNIRSGPGSSYEKLASASNGAEVTILEDAGNGWYKIDYGNGKVGYASSEYISMR